MARPNDQRQIADCVCSNKKPFNWNIIPRSWIYYSVYIDKGIRQFAYFENEIALSQKFVARISNIQGHSIQLN